MLNSKFGRNSLSGNNASESLSMGWSGGDSQGRVIRRNLLESVSNTV